MSASSFAHREWPIHESMAGSAWEENIRSLSSLKWRYKYLLVLMSFFLSYLLQVVFYIKLYMLQLMPCGMFFWCNGIHWGAVLCKAAENRSVSITSYMYFGKPHFLYISLEKWHFGAASSVLDPHSEISREVFDSVGIVLSSSRTNSANSHSLRERN